MIPVSVFSGHKLLALLPVVIFVVVCAAGRCLAQDPHIINQALRFPGSGSARVSPTPGHPTQTIPKLVLRLKLPRTSNGLLNTKKNHLVVPHNKPGNHVLDSQTV
jgi:hypothetical protein